MKIYSCLGILVGLGILICPISSIRAAEDDLVLLSKSETWQVLNSVQKEFISNKNPLEFINLNGEQQAALVILRGVVREEFLDFLPIFVSTETTKIILTIANNIQKLFTISLGEVIGEIESFTVNQAVAKGMDWLLQNGIKVSSGILQNQQVGITFQYVITHQEIDDNHANVAVEFYSPDSIVPPRPTGSMTVGMPYFTDELPKDGKVRPFVVLVLTKIEKIGLGWAVDSSAETEITVEFPEKVPRLQLAKEWPYPLEEQKIKLLNYWTTAKKILEYLRSAGSETLGRTADFAHKAQEVVESFINRASQLLSKSGAGLINPLNNESKQLDAIEAQLNQVKEGLALKEQAVLQDLASQNSEKDETKPGLVGNENLAKLSFPQIQQEVVREEAVVEIKSQQDEATKDEAVLPQEQPILDLVKDTIWCNIDPNRGPGLSTVMFSEIAWMGSMNSANDEWMRLKNISGNEVNLAGWQMLDKDKQITVAFDETHAIPFQGTFLLERTNDESLPAAPANLIYTGALSNTDEALYLFDQNCILRDKAVASPDWLAGDNALKKPMMRSNDLGWYTQGSGNAVSSPLINGSSSPSTANTYAAGSPPPIIYPRILISEIQTAGASSQTEEFVELYNPTQGQVGLIDWYIQKKTQGADSFSTFASKNILSGKTIQAKGYFLIAREGSSFAPSADAVTSYSLADNNTLVLKNPNGEIADKVGWGNVQDAEGSPALNPQAGQSLNRIWDMANQTYYDRDNNSIDFVLHNPASPKAQNIEAEPPPEEPPPPSQDTTPPEVTFGVLSSSQNNTSFSLSWVATDSGGEASASGVQSIFLEYTVTPSATGIFARYDNNGVWTNWQAGSAGKITLNAQAISLSIRGQDGVSYTFQVSASDVAGNTSAAASASTAVALSKTVVINEIAWMGTTASATDEWVELYNATANPIDLTGWTLAADDGTPSIQLAGTIGGGAYFLLERTADTTISDVSANQIYTGALANDGEYLKLSDTLGSLVDAVDASAGWFNGDNATKQSMERVSANQGGSSSSNWVKNNIIQHNGKDAGTAQYYGTPGNFINGTPKQVNSTVTSPTVVDDSDLRFDEFNTITLTNLGSPYLITGISGITIPAGKTLIVEPGVLLKFQDNRGYLRVQGTLKAQGTQTSGIAFTVTDGGAIWCGIKIDATSVASQLDYVVVDKAGGANCNPGVYASMYVDSSAVAMNHSFIQTGSYHRKLYLKNSSSIINALTVSNATLNTDSAGIYIDGGSPTISNSTISNNSIGIFVNSLSNNPTIQNNTFTGNAKAVKLESAGAVLSGNTAIGNTYNGIFVEGATQANTTWQKDSIPYIVNKFTVSAGTTLTIQAGVVAKFINTPSTESAIRVDGTLITQGTPENPVVFTAAADDTVGGVGSYTGTGITTSWERIYIAPGSTGSQLTHATLKYGGNTYYEAALYVKQSDVQLSHVEIAGSTYSGIYSYSGTITGSNITLSNNTYGFHIALGNCPALSAITVIGTLLHSSSLSCSF